MNLVMFTPGLVASAIGRMTDLVVRELCNLGHQVVVIGTESDELRYSPKRDFGTRTLHWTNQSEVESALTDADSCVYHIGDNFKYHQGGIFWLERSRGMVCLHDFFLGHLFCEWAKSNLPQATSILQQWYGEEIAQKYFRYTTSKDFIQTTHDKAPLTEWIASQATAIIAHSQWGIKRILDSCAGPVRVVPLAYATVSGQENPSTNSAANSSSPKIQVLTIGHVNPNKRIECVLQAIGTNNQLRSQITYTLAGTVELDVQEKLEILAAELGVDLKILGEVSDRDLHRLIQQADILCCLRKPTLEAASASAIESMLYGKAVIVENAGFYAELPDDCVQKIDPDQEVPSLQSALLDLISNPVKRRDLAKRAQEWAKETFSARNYALQLLELIPQSQKSVLLHETLLGFARQLSLWNSSAALLNLPETLEPLKIFESNAE